MRSECEALREQRAAPVRSSSYTLRTLFVHSGQLSITWPLLCKFCHFMTTRHRSYVFTHNNPEADWSPEKVWQLDQEANAPRIRFLAGQFEVGDTGTRHFQGYVVFHNPQGLPGCRRLLGGIAPHLEPRKGTHQQAVAYVHKTETREPGAEPFAMGEPPEQGARSDLEDVYESIKEGSSEKELVESHFTSYVKYHAGIRRALAVLSSGLRTEFSPPRSWYLFGASGIGKSRAAWSWLGLEWREIYSVPLSSGSTVWFDGYDPRVHQLILIEDYYHSWKFHFLLKLLDGYPL